MKYYVEGRDREDNRYRRVMEIVADTPKAAAEDFAAQNESLTDIMVWADFNAAHAGQHDRPATQPLYVLRKARIDKV